MFATSLWFGNRGRGGIKRAGLQRPRRQRERMLRCESLEPRTMLSNGWVATDFAQAGDWGMAGAVTADGKLVTVGGAAEVPPNDWGSDFAATRHLADGTLDSTFSSDGKVNIPDIYDSNARATALQPDGKIVLAGTTSKANTMLARLKPDGSLDKGFASKGVFTKDVFPYKVGAPGYEYVEHVLVQPDGKILVAGHGVPDRSFNHVGFVIRLNPDGSMDRTFGKNGVVTPSIPSFRSWFFYGATLQGSKILLTGYVNLVANQGGDMLLMRLNANGSLDTTFGGNGTGWVLADFDFVDRGMQVAVHPNDGKILVGGQISDANEVYRFGLARFDQDGHLDTSFGNNGLVETTPAPGDPWASVDQLGMGMAIQRDGKVVLGSYHPYITNTLYLVRYAYPDGTLDTTFRGGDGIVNEAIGWAQDVKLQPDGTNSEKIVVFGTRYDPVTLNKDFFMARFALDGALDTSFGGTSSSAPTAAAALASPASNADRAALAAAALYDPTAARTGAIDQAFFDFGRDRKSDRSGGTFAVADIDLLLQR